MLDLSWEFFSSRIHEKNQDYNQVVYIRCTKNGPLTPSSISPILYCTLATYLISSLVKHVHGSNNPSLAVVIVLHYIGFKNCHLLRLFGNIMLITTYFAIVGIVSETLLILTTLYHSWRKCRSLPLKV
jgi:hypothetical protein